MLSLVLAVLRSLAAGFHTRRNLVLENLALRRQLLVMNRTIKIPTLRNSDRLFWAAISAMWSRWTKVVVIVQPRTVVRWQQAGFRLFWRWRLRCRSGRTPKDRQLIDRIRRIWRANQTWGSRRIEAELAKLGLQVSAATIRKLARDSPVLRPNLPPKLGTFEFPHVGGLHHFYTRRAA